jgi:dCMP deaminase
MKTQIDWDDLYLEIASVVAKQSYDEKHKVGAVIVKDGNIISFSYNGTLAGQCNETRDGNGETLKGVLHAEAQAIAKVARSNQSTENATMYTTLSPCIDCAKLIVSAGFRRVVYKDLYKSSEGINYLNTAAVLVNYQPNINQFATPEWLAKSGLL